MTSRYNYFEAVCSDIRAYINENEIEVNKDNRDEVFEELNDVLWCEDSVTGNGSGSYTFSTWEAEDNLCHNWDLLREMCEEWGGNFGEYVSRGAEYCDVSLRCYLLASCLDVVLNEYFEE